MSTGKLDIAQLISVSFIETTEFDKHRRHILYSASNEQLLALKLELHEAIGVIEFHTSEQNSVSCWFRDRTKALLEFIEEEVLEDRRKRWSRD